jgi:hypothetical protein
MIDKLTKSISNGVKNLQDKPDHIKTRILWSTSAVAAVLVVTVWFTNFKHQIANISGSDILNINSGSQSQTSAPHYLQVENATRANNQLQIFFQVKNDTNDILNFSPLADISLVLDGKKISPTAVTDRQNQAFVKKVLSNSQTFGILTFDNPEGDQAVLTFDNLYFEQSPENIFKETLDIDLGKLTPPESIRN